MVETFRNFWVLLIQVTSNMIQLTCTWKIGNKVKQCENLKKILRRFNVCCFYTISVKICAK